MPSSWAVSGPAVGRGPASLCTLSKRGHPERAPSDGHCLTPGSQQPRLQPLYWLLKKMALYVDWCLPKSVCWSPGPQHWKCDNVWR